MQENPAEQRLRRAAGSVVLEDNLQSHQSIQWGNQPGVLAKEFQLLLSIVLNIHIFYAKSFLFLLYTLT